MSLKTALSKMTTKQKLDHIWEYYKVHIFVAVTIAYFVGWGINHYIINPPRSTFINVSFYGQFVPHHIRDELLHDIEVSLSPDVSRYEAQMLNFFFSEVDPQQNMAAHTQFGVMVGARELDILLVHNDYLQTIIGNNFPLDLGGILPFDKLGDLTINGQLVFGNRYQTSPLEHIEPVVIEENLPLGISLANVPYFASKDPMLNYFTLIVMANTTRTQAVIDFIEHTLGGN